jgi:hypothetical protein
MAAAEPGSVAAPAVKTPLRRSAAAAEVNRQGRMLVASEPVVSPGVDTVPTVQFESPRCGGLRTLSFLRRVQISVCITQSVGHAAAMTAPYDIRKDLNGWTVIDIETGMPAEVDDYLQINMSMEDADDLADLLNHLATEAEQCTNH